MRFLFTVVGFDMQRRSRFFASCIGLTLSLGCSDSSDSSESIASLRAAARPSGRTVGAAISASRLDDAAYAAAAREFSTTTPENELKWGPVEPEPGVFNFDGADRIVALAAENDMLVRGHTLVWHSQLPDWVKAISDRDELLAVIERHINEVVGRYRGRIYAWDVVNEAFTDWRGPPMGQTERPAEFDPHVRGTHPNDDDPMYAELNAGTNGLDSVFGRVIGPEYVELAFRLAHAADPDALLFLNDFNAEGLGAKSDVLYQFVSDLKAAGVPIHGVGLQMHISVETMGDRTTANIVQNMQRLADLGLQIHITEFDISLCGMLSLEERRALQADRWREIAEACVNQPACTAITTWGIADPNSWRDRECSMGGERSEPLLFDSNYQRKPVYDIFAAALRDHPAPAAVRY